MKHICFYDLLISILIVSISSTIPGSCNLIANASSFPSHQSPIDRSGIISYSVAEIQTSGPKTQNLESVVKTLELEIQTLEHENKTSKIQTSKPGSPDLQKSSTRTSSSSKNTVTKEDLQKLSEALFIKDVNNAMNYITLNLQKQTTKNNSVDEAPLQLFNVKPEAFQILTIQKVISIYDNYHLDTRIKETINMTQRQEESLLVDTFLSTNVMSLAMRFLANKGFIKQDYNEYKELLQTTWFNIFSRGKGEIGSSSFEHVFMNELKRGKKIIGLHNWIYFYSEELKKRVDYQGYMKKLDLGKKASILSLQFKFHSFKKPISSLFVGTSPELEMSLYTVCFMVRPNKLCPVSLGGTKFNIITHKLNYRGKEYIGSAYPIV